MAGVYKRPSDKARGKAGKWTAWWIDERGGRRKRVAFTDKAESLKLANDLETEARRVREGLADPGEKARKVAGQRPLADHIADYRASLLAKGDKAKHAQHIAGALTRLLADAAIGSVADLAPDRLQEALGRLRTKRSARTTNHALRAVQAFARWLEHSNRIREVPRGLLAIPLYSEDVDRRRVRRVLTVEELNRLLAVTEIAPPEFIYGPTKSKIHKVPITGPARATLYRLAMGTGFRANELRSLTPESFNLDGDEPTVTVEAAYSKNGKRAVQPITRGLASALRPFVADRPLDLPVLIVPEKTARMLRGDLGRAGIPYKDAAGRVLDFHALRHSYITHLVASGANPKIVQTLARHSTITLTLDRYTHVEEQDVRGALERGQK